MRIHTDEPALFRRESIKKLPVRLQPLRPMHSEKPIDLDIFVNINFKINGNALTSTLPLSTPSSRKLPFPATHDRYSDIFLSQQQISQQILIGLYSLSHFLGSSSIADMWTEQISYAIKQAVTKAHDSPQLTGISSGFKGEG